MPAAPTMRPSSTSMGSAEFEKLCEEASDKEGVLMSRRCREQAKKKRAEEGHERMKMARKQMLNRQMANEAGADEALQMTYDAMIECWMSEPALSWRHVSDYADEMQEQAADVKRRWAADRAALQGTSPTLQGTDMVETVVRNLIKLYDKELHDMLVAGEEAQAQTDDEDLDIMMIDASAAAPTECKMIDASAAFVAAPTGADKSESSDCVIGDSMLMIV